MSSALIRGLVVSLGLIGSASLMAQEDPPKPVKPTGPAAKKAQDLINSHIGRIEKEITQGHKEVELLRAELHELIDVRDAMSEAIAELRGELATKGTFSADPVVPVQPTQKAAAPARGIVPGTLVQRDFVYSFGSFLPKDPTQDQRENLRRLAPRAELNRMIQRLRADVDETRAEVDDLAIKLLHLSAGIPISFWGSGGMGGMGGGVAGQSVPWFGSMGMAGGNMR